MRVVGMNAQGLCASTEQSVSQDHPRLNPFKAGVCERSSPKVLVQRCVTMVSPREENTPSSEQTPRNSTPDISAAAILLLSPTEERERHFAYTKTDPLSPYL